MSISKKLTEMPLSDLAGLAGWKRCGRFPSLGHAGSTSAATGKRPETRGRHSPEERSALTCVRPATPPRRAPAHRASVPTVAHQEITGLREKDAGDSSPGTRGACPARFAPGVYRGHC